MTDWLTKESRRAAQPPAENGRVQLADTLADCWPGMRGNNAGGDAIESNNQENRQRDRRPVTLPDKGEAGSRSGGGGGEEVNGQTKQFGSEVECCS